MWKGITIASQTSSWLRPIRVQRNYSTISDGRLCHHVCDSLIFLLPTGSSAIIGVTVLSLRFLQVRQLTLMDFNKERRFNIANFMWNTARRYSKSFCLAVSNSAGSVISLTWVRQCRYFGPSLSIKATTYWCLQMELNFSHAVKMFFFVLRLQN